MGLSLRDVVLRAYPPKKFYILIFDSTCCCHSVRLILNKILMFFFFSVKINIPKMTKIMKLNINYFYLSPNNFPWLIFRTINKLLLDITSKWCFSFSALTVFRLCRLWCLAYNFNNITLKCYQVTKNKIWFIS